MKSGNVKDLTQAWDLYYHVFRRISKQLPQVGAPGRVNCHYSPLCFTVYECSNTHSKASGFTSALGQVIVISNPLKNS